MENLSIRDSPGPGPRPPPPIPQLPPQLFTTAASLLELTDKKLLVSLRDGRKLIGILRSWDQYGNLVLQSTIERRFLQKSSSSNSSKSNDNGEADPSVEATHIFSDEDKGIFLVRGENIVLMGEIDLDKDDTPSSAHFTAATPHQLHVEEKLQEPLQKKRDALRAKKLQMLGFEEEHRRDVIF